MVFLLGEFHRVQEYFCIDFKCFIIALILSFNGGGRERHKSRLGRLQPAKISEEFLFQMIGKDCFSKRIIISHHLISLY